MLGACLEQVLVQVLRAGQGDSLLSLYCPPDPSMVKRKKRKKRKKKMQEFRKRSRGAGDTAGHDPTGQADEGNPSISRNLRLKSQLLQRTCDDVSYRKHILPPWEAGCGYERVGGPYNGCPSGTACSALGLSQQGPGEWEKQTRSQLAKITEGASPREGNGTGLADPSWRKTTEVPASLPFHLLETLISFNNLLSHRSEVTL